MIRNFTNKATEDIYNGTYSVAARRLLPKQLVLLAQQRLDYLNIAEELLDLKVVPEFDFRVLHEKRKGQCAIKIYERYYICFTWPIFDPADVEIAVLQNKEVQHVA